MRPENVPEPVLTDLETVRRRPAYQSLQPVRRPDHWGVDRDRSRRPGVPMERAEPRPFPNTRYPPERQRGDPASPMHGRPNKLMPPVFGTALPLRGLAGAVRRLAYRLPDHAPSHWALELLGDRVELWTRRARRLAPVAIGLGVLGWALRARR